MAVGDVLVSSDEIREARHRLGSHVVRTPLLPMWPSDVWLKAESLQPSGAFKLRGAFNSLLHLDERARAAGVVAHSSGNHAIAVAYAAAKMGIHAVIVMPGNAPATKIHRTRALGAEVVLVGNASSERLQRAAELVDEHGYRLIEPYDSRDIISATGTITLEVLEQADELGLRVSEIYVPISGGGLAAGVATAAKSADPSIRVVGVEPELAADAYASRMAGHIVALTAEQTARTVADGLRVQQVGALPWPHLEAYVDEIVTVSEDEILDAVRRVATEARLVAEPSGATSVAAALVGRGSGAGAGSGVRVAVLSGGNVDLDLYARILAGGSVACEA